MAQLPNADRARAHLDDASSAGSIEICAKSVSSKKIY
jgi:hypothetical protein